MAASCFRLVSVRAFVLNHVSTCCFPLCSFLEQTKMDVHFGDIKSIVDPVIAASKYVTRVHEHARSLRHEFPEVKTRLMFVFLACVFSLLGLRVVWLR
jgi:hypothetical protein